MAPYTVSRECRHTLGVAQDPERIIVGVDGSESSVDALRRGEKITVAMGARLTVMTCWTVPAKYHVPYSLATIDFKGAAQEVQSTAIERAFGLDWPRNLTTALVQGPARPTLINASHDATLLVLGRRGLGGFKGLLMGSVSTACITHAHCPVVVVPARIT